MLICKENKENKKYIDICKIKSNISERISLINRTKYFLYQMNDKGPKKIKLHLLFQGTQNTIGSTLFCFWKSKQKICLLEGWIRQKTGSKCKQMYFIPETTQLIFGGLNINNKQCSTFTFMYLVLFDAKFVFNFRDDE